MHQIPDTTATTRLFPYKKIFSRVLKTLVRKRLLVLLEELANKQRLLAITSLQCLFVIREMAAFHSSCVFSPSCPYFDPLATTPFLAFQDTILAQMRESRVQSFKST